MIGGAAQSARITEPLGVIGEVTESGDFPGEVIEADLVTARRRRPETVAQPEKGDVMVVGGAGGLHEDAPVSTPELETFDLGEAEHIGVEGGVTIGVAHVEHGVVESCDSHDRFNTDRVMGYSQVFSSHYDPSHMAVLGVDIGGSGIKAALVDPTTGELLSDRERIGTPDPSTPEAVAEVVTELHSGFDQPERVGIAFPAVVRHGVTLSAANVDDSWIGAPARALFSKALGLDVVLLNDADAAGIAEERFGAAADQDGVVLLLTLGTGIGSALLVDGNLVPNTEFGHLELKGHDPVEGWASSNARKREDLSFEAWARRVAVLLRHLDKLLSPDLFVIGGGISKSFHEYREYLDVDAPVVAATLGNQAGIVGAGVAAGM